MMVLSPPVAIESLFGFLASFLGAFVLAAIPGFFALGHSDFDFGDAVAEIDVQGNDRQTFGFGATRKFMNFTLVKKKFAIAERLVIPGTARQVLRDVGVDQIWAAGLEVHIGVADVGLAFAQRFHFGAVQDQPGFELFKKVIVVGGGAILRDDLLARLGALFTLRLLSVFRRPGHNLSFYLMTRLTRMSGKAAPSGPLVPSCRPSWEKKAGELSYGTV